MDLGKYTVGPSIATARFLPGWESFLIGSFTQQISVSGDPVRRSINLSRETVQINTIWADRWWTIAQTVWQVDWEQSTKGSMTLELELGRNVVGKWGVFVRPGYRDFWAESSRCLWLEHRGRHSLYVPEFLAASLPD